MALDGPKETDETHEIDGLKLFVAADVAANLGSWEQVLVDHVESVYGAGFYVGKVRRAPAPRP